MKIKAFALLILLSAALSEAPVSAQNVTGPHYGASVGTLSPLACKSGVYSSIGGVTDLPEAIFSTDCILEPNDTAPAFFPGQTHNLFDIYARKLIPGVTELLSTNSAGIGGNGGSSEPRVSSDGRFVVFKTLADDIAPPDTNGLSDIILLDRLTGLKERCSVGLGGAEPNGDCSEPDVSNDGRYVVYYSLATNLVLNDTNGFQDAFFYDRVTGVTTRVGSGPFASQPNAQSFGDLRIAGDGSLVIWKSWASNLSPVDPGVGSDIFAWSPLTGLTELISVPLGGVTNVFGSGADISDDGNIIAYVSDPPIQVIFLNVASGVRTSTPYIGGALQMSGSSKYMIAYVSGVNLPFPFSSNATSDVVRGDTQSGVVHVTSTSPGGYSSFSYCFPLAISPSGRYVLYRSGSTTIVPTGPGGYHEPPITVVTDMGPSRSLGPGTTGSYGHPPRTHIVNGQGSPNWGISLMYTIPYVPAYLALKVGPAGMPSTLLGGNAYPWPPDAVLALTTLGTAGLTPIANNLVFPFVWDPSTPAGTQVQAQWVVADPANAFGATLSNAIIVDRP